MFFAVRVAFTHACVNIEAPFFPVRPFTDPVT